ncbi:MAG TPA: YfiR family protein [Aliidongia sp.]|nr:YfiR family protein [Aliidongia sp.]
MRRSRSAAIRPTRRRLAGVLAALACLAAVEARAQDSSAVAAIEAAYLTKFAAFVEWPADGQPLGAATLCVLAPDAIARLVEQVESKLQTDAGPPTVRRLTSEGQAADCRILFIANADRRVPPPVSPPTPTLTITDQATEGRKGVINFIIDEDRVRFEIDDAEAARRGLTISSKLLSLAVSVKPRM